jgi:hypothetical protein
MRRGSAWFFGGWVQPVNRGGPTAYVVIERA